MKHVRDTMRTVPQAYLDEEMTPDIDVKNDWKPLYLIPTPNPDKLPVKPYAPNKALVREFHKLAQKYQAALM